MRFIKHITSLFLLLTIITNCYSQDITLNTQADVNALDPTLTVINGNLLIDDDGTDGIYDLGIIANITSVTGNLTIRDNDQLTYIIFPNLSEIGGSFNIHNSVSAIIFASGLTTIGGNLNIQYNSLSSGLVDLGLPNLSTIGANFILTGSHLQYFNGLPSLSSLGGSFHILTNPDLISIGDFPNLNTIPGNLLIGDRHVGSDTLAEWPNPNLTDISGLSNLSSVQGFLKVIKNNSLTSLSALQNITNLGGSLIIDFNQSLDTLNAFSTFTSINGDLTIASSNLSHINELSGITSLSGKLEIGNNPSLSNLSGISNITTIGGSFSVYSMPLLANLDAFSNITSYPRDIRLSSNPLLTDIDIFLNVTNIGGNLNLYNLPLITNLDAFQNVLSIGGGLSIYNLPLTNLDAFQNISDIGEYLSLTSLSLANIDAFQNVTSLGGELRISNCSQLTNINNFANLTSIGSTSVTFFTTSLYIVGNQSLANIDGLLGLSAINSNIEIKNNPLLENLNGLGNIQNVGHSLTITNNSSLTNCCAIQQLLLTPGSIGWNIDISGNPSECSSESDILESSCSVASIIQGNVFLDLNDNCLLNAIDHPLESTTVEASSMEHTYITSTDSLGNYKIYVHTGLYEVKTLLEMPYSEPCVPFYTADIQNTNQTINIDIPITPIIECPYLEIDISTPVLRQCFDNYYTVEYCNLGTQNAADTYIELELHDSLMITDAEIPFTGPDINNIYTFQIGDINIGDCTEFNVNIQLPCIPGQAGAFQGQTLCVNAHIYPDSSCLAPSPDWDGSSTKVESECVGDSIQFKIINKGAGDMATARTFYVIEDQVMFYQADYQLLAGEEMQISYEANGSTFRLEADQALGHPGNSNPSVAEEACLGGSSNTVSLGMINQFPQDEADPFVSIDCTTVTGSYDPNDKQGFPNGYGAEHYIEKNTDLEYLIRFQNTGTDTAFTVVVTDTISPLLNITTIEPGVSSHPFTFEVLDNLVTFTFNDILLVDSFTNEAASHGFIKYQISQLPDLANGNIIENTAEIYFDFNPPIVTNTTFHTIGENFVTINLVNDILDLYQIKSIRAYPNPFVENITFELEGLENEIEFQLYDVSGKEVFHTKYASPHFLFNRGNLNAGIYFYSIKIEGSVLASGKIVLR